MLNFGILRFTQIYSLPHPYWHISHIAMNSQTATYQSRLVLGSRLSLWQLEWNQSGVGTDSGDGSLAVRARAQDAARPGRRKPARRYRADAVGIHDEPRPSNTSLRHCTLAASFKPTRGGRRASELGKHWKWGIWRQKVPLPVGTKYCKVSALFTYVPTFNIILDNIHIWLRGYFTILLMVYPKDNAY